LAPLVAVMENLFPDGPASADGQEKAYDGFALQAFGGLSPVRGPAAAVTALAKG
jgi:hypothetical protein